jgi:hypothetical protein
VDLTLGAAFQACGGLDPANVTIVDEQGDAGMASSSGGNDAGGGDGSMTEARGGDGSTPGEGGSAGEMTGSGGSSDGDCSTGEPCLNGPDVGLCVEGAFSQCNDPGDDSACIAVYGADHRCIAGACIAAECRTDDDCKGSTCINYLCAPCLNDSDCTEPDTICNTTTGACVTDASCGAAQNGAACPVNPQDRCCGTAGKCEAVQCCGTAACFTDSTLKDPDGLCEAGVCVRASCSAPPVIVRYVDFQALPGGGGSKDCPFNDLGRAVDSLANTGGTVLVALGGVSTIEQTITVGAGITITGADEDWAACTPTTCASPAKWSQLTTGNHRAFDMRSAGQRNIRYLRILGLPNADFQASTLGALYATAASVHLDHVEISGYQFGLYGATGGSLSLGAGVHVHHCRTGLHLDDGAASAGGSADLKVVVGDAPISFDHNNYGFVVHGNARFTLSGPPAGRGSTALITANENFGPGVFFDADNAKSAVIDGLEVAKNGTDAELVHHDGATIFAHSVIKVRNSYFHDNVGNGIHIPGNGPNSADGLSGIDLGKNTTSNAGNNSFINNGDAGICVDPKVATPADTNSLSAQGNVFRTSGGDCRANGTYTRASACDKSGADYAGACAGAADLESCKPSNTCK